jgi:hypothetical protein
VCGQVREAWRDARGAQAGALYSWSWVVALPLLLLLLLLLSVTDVVVASDAAVAVAIHLLLANILAQHIPLEDADLHR